VKRRYWPLNYVARMAEFSRKLIEVVVCMIAKMMKTVEASTLGNE
jgi:hypothetical protein